jgi:hypothetical protein
LNHGDTSYNYESISFGPSDRIFANIRPHTLNRGYLVRYDSVTPTPIGDNGPYIPAEFNNGARPWMLVGGGEAYDAFTGNYTQFDPSSWSHGLYIDYWGRFVGRVYGTSTMGVFNDAGQLVSTFQPDPLLYESFSPRLGIEWQTCLLTEYIGGPSPEKRMYGFSPETGRVRFDSVVENFPTGSLLSMDYNSRLKMNRNDYGYGTVDGRMVAFAPVPEPSSMLALGAGLVAILRRRKRSALAAARS